MRQSGVERLIWEGLADPELAVALMKKHGKLTSSEKGNLLQRLYKIGETQVWDRNLQKINNALEDKPGVIMEILKEVGDPGAPLYAPEQSPEDRRGKRGLGVYDPNYNPFTYRAKPGASLGPSPASPVPGAAPNPASVLSQVNPVGTNPQTAARGQQVFGAMDPIFSGPMTAAKGGIASIKPKKPRQMVL